MGRVTKGRTAWVTNALTEEQLQWLRDNYRTTKKEEILSTLGLSKSSLYTLAKRLGLVNKQKPNPHRTLTTQEQEEWLRKHFKNTPNAKIQLKYGWSHSTLHRIARELGLVKTLQYMDKCHAYTTEMATAAHKRIKKEEPERYAKLLAQRRENLAHKEGRKNRFEKGVNNKMRLSPKKYAEWKEKCSKKWKETLAAERMRYRMGLPQKTKFTRHLKTLTPEARKRYQAKWHLKNALGYIWGEGYTMYYDDNTKRSPKEHLYVKRYKIKFVDKNEEKRRDIKAAPDWTDKTGGTHSGYIGF